MIKKEVYYTWYSIWQHPKLWKIKDQPIKHCFLCYFLLYFTIWIVFLFILFILQHCLSAPVLLRRLIHTDHRSPLLFIRVQILFENQSSVFCLFCLKFELFYTSSNNYIRLYDLPCKLNLKFCLTTILNRL